MAWLVSGGQVLASLEVAEGRTARARGLLGRTSLEGALLLQPARSVHTIGMRFPIDVAYCDAQFQVVEVITMARNRVGRPRLSCRSVVEAEAGSFERWGLKSGMDLEVKE